MTSEPQAQTRIFLSHASEDKARVIQVYAKLAEEMPDIVSWLDIFEITGGDSLIEKIAEGMDESQKFFIFLSEVSVGKPWVQAELKRALNHEITGIKPGFIVPVKFGGLSKIPAFLEDKRYIDLDSLTAREWLAEFRAAIDGKVADKSAPAASNLSVYALENPDSSQANIGQIAFSTSSWAETISFQVATKAQVETVTYSLEGDGVVHGGARNFSRMNRPDRVGFALPGMKLSPGQVFRLTLTFPEGVSFKDHIGLASAWDGSGHTNTGIHF